jgi:hypothetical protein
LIDGGGEGGVVSDDVAIIDTNNKWIQEYKSYKYI